MLTEKQIVTFLQFVAIPYNICLLFEVTQDALNASYLLL